MLLKTSHSWAMILHIQTRTWLLIPSLIYANFFQRKGCLISFKICSQLTKCTSQSNTYVQCQWFVDVVNYAISIHNTNVDYVNSEKSCNAVFAMGFDIIHGWCVAMRHDIRYSMVGIVFGIKEGRQSSQEYMQLSMMTAWHDSVFRITEPNWEESIGHWRIPLTKGQ